MNNTQFNKKMSRKANELSQVILPTLLKAKKAKKKVDTTKLMNVDVESLRNNKNRAGVKRWVATYNKVALQVKASPLSL